MPKLQPVSLTKSLRKRQKIVAAILANTRKPQLSFENIYPIILSWIEGVGIPIVAVGLSLLIKIRLSMHVGESTAFSLFFIPILISTIISGMPSGIIALILGTSSIIYLFLQPSQSFTLNESHLIALCLYIGEAIFTIYIIGTQRKSQKALAATEERFRLLSDNAKDYAILFLDVHGYISQWNNGAQRIFGYKETEAIGKHFSLLFIPSDREKGLPYREYYRALTKNRSSDENYLMRKNGSIFWASGTTTPLWDTNDHLLGLAKIVRDATRIREIEQQRRDFISIAAHELKTPVTGLQLYIQRLEQFLKTNPKLQAYAIRIDNQLKQLTGLVNTLLDVSRLENGKLQVQKEPVALVPFIDTIIETMQSANPQRRIQRIGTTKKKVDIDKNRIEEVLINFISNALKYSSEVSPVTIFIRQQKTGIKIQVTDYGIGIPKENLPHIFERFYRAKNVESGTTPGIGLGLYISSQIIKAHGSRITVKSKQGKGSTFSFTLPYVK